MQTVSIADRMDRLPVQSIHRKITAIIGIGLFFDIYDIFLAGTISTVLAKKFHVGSGVLPLLIGSSFLGMFLGAIILNRMADSLGRRKAYLVNLAVYSLFTFLGALSPSVAILIVFRFLAGFGIGAEPPLSDAYLSEMLPTRVRGSYIAWAYTLSFVGIPIVGFLALGLVPNSPLGVAGWRWLFVIGALGSVITWFFQKSLPESPRWLESVGRREEAEKWLAQFEQGASAPQSVTGRAHANSAGLADKASGSNTNVRNHAGKVNAGKVNIGILFGHTYAKRTFMLWLFQILQTLGYYGFGTLVPVVLAAKGYTIVHSLEFTSLSFIGYPVGSLLSLLVVERIQRKWLIVGSAFTMGLFGLLFGFSSSSSLIVLFGFLYTLVSNIFSNAYHIFQAEIFPTAVRATAAGWGYSLSRLMSGLMPFILLPVLHAHGAGAMFSYVAIAMVVIMLDIGILGPKTTGVSLETVNSVSA
jgi:MFS transporter, putative metabolite:H+ symporter